MKNRANVKSIAQQVSLLVISESSAVREILSDWCRRVNSLVIAGEATNSPEALDMLYGVHPNVILLDPEMTLNDDTTLLEWVMSHQPTPTIILPSLMRTGVQRTFEALKNGAVDFVWFESILENQDSDSFQQQLLNKITSAAKIDMTPPQVFEFSKRDSKSEAKKQTEIIFCEECGARNIFESSQGKDHGQWCCINCGDLLQTHLINQYKRVHYVTVIAAGTGSYSNLLRMIPNVPAEMSGAIIISIYEDGEYIDAFIDYLNSVSRIEVVRIKNDTSIEGGNCYVTTAGEHFCMKPYSTRNTMAVAQQKQGYGPVDLLMLSISTIFRENTAGLILSGTELDGTKGIQSIKNNNGISAVLFAPNCLHRQMGENVLRQCKVDKIVDENDATGFIFALHDAARDTGSAA